MISQNRLKQIIFRTMQEYNEKLETNFSGDTVEIAFFTKETGREVYESFCSKYFPKYLREDYKSPGYFESFAAQAFIGSEKDGMLIRTDIDITIEEWHHMILHELSHILACHEEIEEGNFFDKYCENYAENTIQDGYINSGYAIWREFSAELFAMDLDDNINPYSLECIKEDVVLLCEEIVYGNPNAKEATYRLLIALFKSDEYYKTQSIDGFLLLIKQLSLYQLWNFEKMIRLIYQHLTLDEKWMIDVDFIEALGAAYIDSLMRNTLKT